MIVNVWIALSDTAKDRVVEYLRWDEETQGDYNGPLTREQGMLFEYMQDRATRIGTFAKPTLSGRQAELWQLDFDTDTDPVARIRRVLDELIAAYPGRLAIVGVWKRDGAMLGCQLVLTEVANPDYVGEPFRIPNPNFNDDVESPDYDPRKTLRNPAWVPETIVQRSQTGTPTYPLPNYLWRFMPDWVGATSNADLTDVNLLFGQQPRVFS